MIHSHPQHTAQNHRTDSRPVCVALSQINRSVDTFSDEKLGKVTDTARFELKDGRFGTSDYVASSIDDKGINFEPFGKAKILSGGSAYLIMPGRLR